MTKRKKKVGGGGFGSGKKTGLSAAKPSLKSIMSVRDKEHMTKLIHKIVASKNFGSIEEMQQFVQDHLANKEMEELETMVTDAGPPSDFDRAESLIAGIPEGTAPKEVLRIAKQALALSEYCMGAWFEYGVYAEDTNTALERFEQGIEIGRVRFEEQIRECDEGLGLWDYIEARDFMRLLEEKAKALVELNELDKAMEAYQEILVLNPVDNQGIRSDLLHIYMLHRRLDDAHTLLDRFPNDAMVDMAYGRALLEILETVEKTGFQIANANGPGAPASPAALLKSLGPEFHPAVKLLKHAVKVNPFVPLFMTHGSILGVKADDLACFGGPYEAVIYAQHWCFLWYITGLPYLLLNGALPENLQKFSKAPHIVDELIDVADQLDELDLVAERPWWARFEEDAM